MYHILLSHILEEKRSVAPFSPAMAKVMFQKSQLARSKSQLACSKSQLARWFVKCNVMMPAIGFLLQRFTLPCSYISSRFPPYMTRGATLLGVNARFLLTWFQPSNCLTFRFMGLSKYW